MKPVLSGLHIKRTPATWVPFIPIFTVKRRCLADTSREGPEGPEGPKGPRGSLNTGFTVSAFRHTNDHF